MDEKQFLVLLKTKLQYLTNLDGMTARLKVLNDLLPLVGSRIQDVEKRERAAKREVD